ncbi:MAG: RNA polymerase factor sigma-32 [Mesorhizobium sp.]|nr:RNA polymerase factor sigma-32 [Mesorhizobium sp.]
MSYGFPRNIFSLGAFVSCVASWLPRASHRSTGVTKEPVDRALVRAAMQAAYLDREEEHDLAVRWKEEKDQQALHRMTTSHMRLVISMASKFRYYGLPMGDLIQEGHVGLLEAAARFDPERDVRFSTYAGWWIRASIQDYVLRNWSIVRGGTSSAQKALFFNLRRLRARLAQGPGMLSSIDIRREIAVTLGVSESDVALMDSRLSASDTSLNAPVTEDGASSAERSDFLVSDGPLPDEIAEETIDVERRAIWLKDALRVLNDREMKIIEERRLSEEGATLEALGETLGISKERVRQIENRALEKLKIALVRQGTGFLAA